jgi:hypothetical protein
MCDRNGFAISNPPQWEERSDPLLGPSWLIMFQALQEESAQNIQIFITGQIKENLNQIFSRYTQGK